MDDYKILLGAILDASAKGDIDKQLNAMKDLSVTISKATLSNDVINDIKRQLTQNGIDLKLVFGNTNQIINQAQQVGQQIGQQINQGVSQGFAQNTNAIDSFKKSLSNAGKSSTEINNIVEKVKLLNVQIDSLRFSESTDGFMNIDVSGLDEFGNKVKITQSLLQDLQTMQWNVANTTTSVISTKELDKINNAFADYTQKLAQFKSTNTNILSGLVQPLSDFETKLSELKTGTATINEVANSFKSLNTEASKITENFSRQLSPIDSAIRKLANGEETIASLKAEFKGLANTPKEVSSELNKCISLLENVKKIESEQGRTAEWANAYRTWSDSLDALRAKLKTLQAEQANNISSTIVSKDDIKDLIYVQRILNTISATEDRVRSKLSQNGFTNIEISGIEDVNGKVEKLTVTATNAAGALEKFNLVRQKVQGGGKSQRVQDWLVQSGDVQVIKSATTAQESLADAMARGREQAELARQAEEKRQQLAQNNAINKNLEEEYLLRQKLVQTANDAIKSGIIDKNVSNVSLQYSKLSNVTDELKADFTELKRLQDALGTSQADEELISNYNKFNDTLLKVKNTITILNNEQKQQLSQIQYNSSTGTYANQVQQQYEKYNKLGLELTDVKFKIEALDTAEKNLRTVMVNENATIEQQRAAYEQFNVALSNSNKATTLASNMYMSSDAVNNLIANLTSFMQKNTAMTSSAKAEINDWIAKLQNAGVVYKSVGNEAVSAMKQIEVEQRQLGRLGDNFITTLKKGMQSFTSWLSATFIVMRTFTAVKSAFTSITALDTALVDLKKTTTMTASELENFYYAANDVAKQMGVTTEEILTQASAWSRLGYSSTEAATQMAKLSSQFVLISPGMDLDTATSGLVSIMKAYDIKVEDVLDGIESKINIIGNSFALSNSNIVSMLQDSVSAMAESNNSLEETIALETAAYEIVQDNSVGNGFKTVALRLRGLNEETEELDDSLKTISGDLYDLTGVSIMEDANTYKSTYQILKEISEVWDSLTDVNQASALELMFGKLRANIGSAVIKNFSAAEEAMEKMANSAGSADAELSVAMDSITYKLNALKETGVGISQNLFQRDDMKAIVDVLTSVGEVIDWLTEKIGLFGSIGLGAGLFAGIKNVGRTKMLVLS